MAYIPPHRRVPAADGDASASTSSPVPELLPPPHPRPRNAAPQRDPGISFASTCSRNWFTAGLDYLKLSTIYPPVRLETVPSKTARQEGGENHLVLINTDIEEERSDEVRARVIEDPWYFIAGDLTRVLLSSFVHLRPALENPGIHSVKPIMAARFGKIIFRSFSPESMKEALCNVDSLDRLKKYLDTNVPKSYFDYVVGEGARKIGLELKMEKDIFVVLLSDSSRPDEMISCKCRARGEDGKLEVFKLELAPSGYMVIDISCLEENIDFQLLLSAKRDIKFDLTNNDTEGIQDIIGAAITDPATKGGLRWPVGKDSSGDRFTVSQSRRIKTKIFANSSMKLKARNCDQFDFGKSTGESSQEVFVHLKKVISKLKEGNFDEILIREMLEADLKCLWGSFFRCESFLKW